MTHPDAPESKAADAADQIGHQIGALWMAAHTDGIRNGLEAAAALAGEVAQKISDDYSMNPDVRAISVHCLNEMRDIIRLTALQLPEPQPPEVTGG